LELISGIIPNLFSKEGNYFVSTQDWANLELPNGLIWVASKKSILPHYWGQTFTKFPFPWFPWILTP